MLLSLSFIAAMLSSSGRADTSTSVDMIELNHHYTPKGEPAFDQIIFWGRNPADGKYNVRSWCLADGCYPITVDGITRFENKDYQVHSRLFRESWTQKDPESVNKLSWPESKRVAVPYKHPKPLTRQDDNNQAASQ